MQTQRENGKVQMIKIMETTKMSPETKLPHTESSSTASVPFRFERYFPSSFLSSMVMIGVRSEFLVSSVTLDAMVTNITPFLCQQINKNPEIY